MLVFSGSERQGRVSFIVKNGYPTISVLHRFAFELTS